MAAEDLVVHRRLTLPARELRWSFARSGGPGGQNVNKVETKAILRFHVAGSPTLSEDQRRRLLRALAPRLSGDGWLVIQASRSRQRARNREEARERLARLLGEGLRRRRKRVPTRPTRGSVERRLTEKRRRGDVKRRRKERPE